MDGVIYIEDSLIEGSKEVIQSLRSRGKKLAFLTNNSTRTRGDYTQKLADLGLDCAKSEVMTSAYATSLRLSEKAEGKTCYVVGEEGLKRELEKAGFEILPRGEAERASFVVVGMDRGLNYEKIWGGLTALLSGADFIATNPDTTYCTREGLAPGAAASIGALSATAEREPSEIVGKPSPFMLKASLDILNVSPQKAAIVGDRIDTDIKAGKELGLTTILVLTGVDSRQDLEEVKDTELEPDFVLSSIDDFPR
ncbi:hypothetical protein AKJ37_02040 [candidate division MSBL1 archaeon SCGC-AAA259I09]|uniref:HAD family hydrolase n=3 Tax=candidate division MSBL1 TaxID=215777 RepID=A0A133UUK6_9EURY|nr:hypothetical protein AKJ61_01380 [candidate division MSBL1 archaeon SCGC-AAA259B11]KXA93710.1 hypothetical protein AKJ66_01315 [candidate division MSBL1 archaeon SCGC-AAA259E22]KXA97898.1 hypothetical protein AKJ37_02040 [candidate division MSBL1 archaeon SCGC-AAA259I09]